MMMNSETSLQEGAVFLFFRSGGTENFRWNRVLVGEAEIEAKRIEIMTMGYPTIVALEAPTEFEPAKAWGGKSMPWRVE